MPTIVTTTASNNYRTTARSFIQKKRENSTTGKSMLKFKKITSEDMEKIFPYLLLDTGRTTDFSFGGILMWVDFYNYEFCIYKDTLFIKGLSEDNRINPCFSFPLGSLPLNESLALLKEYCKEQDIRLQFSAVPEYAKDLLEEYNPVLIEELRDFYDYLYSAEKLSTLSGKKMAKKRNHCNHFQTEYPDWKLEFLNKDNLQKALDLMDIYDTERDNNLYAENESLLSRKMLMEAAKHDSRMIGAILLVGNRTVGVTLGDVKNDTLYIHIEKALREVSGSYEFINKAFAEKICSLYPEIKYINREDDCGDIGLRMAKESYHPDMLLKKYNIFF